MKLLRAFLGWCSGDASGEQILREGAMDLGRPIFRRSPQVSVDALEDVIQQGLWRLWRSKQRKLVELAAQCGLPDLEPLMRQAALRGALPEDVEQSIGRTLSDREHLLWVGRPSGDALVCAYLRQMLVNGLRDLLREAQAAPVDLERLAAPEEEGADLRAAEALLDRLLPGFGPWSESRQRGSGPRNLEALEELEALSRLGSAGQGRGRSQDPALSAEEQEREAWSQQRRWSRARARLHEYLDELRLSPEERQHMPLVHALVDERFRIKDKAVRRSPLSPSAPLRKS
jgi:hypothetical protein